MSQTNDLVVLDSDVLILYFRRTFGTTKTIDPRFQPSEQIISLIQSNTLRGATTIINLLELCGDLSYTIRQEVLKKLYAGFANQYNVKILFPKDSYSPDVLEFRVSETLNVIMKKVHFADALIINILEENPGAGTFITWNKKDFDGRTALRVRTPEEYLSELPEDTPG